MTTITPTVWLLLGMVVFLLIAVGALIVIKLINRDWEQMTGEPMFSEPPYRTASAATIRTQTHQIIAKANANMQATIATKSACTQQCNQGRMCACKPDITIAETITGVRNAANTAALRDLWDDKATPNPYERGTLAHSAWRNAYRLTVEGESRRHAS